MKTKVRIFSTFLIVFLLLSAFATGGAAEESETAPGDVLFKENFDKSLLDRLGWKTVSDGDYPTVQGKDFSVEISDKLGENNKCLQFASLTSTWSMIEIVSGEKMQGLTKYTLSITMKLEKGLDWHRMTDLRFGGADAKSALGDWVGMRWANGTSDIYMENHGYNYDGATDVQTKPYAVGETMSFSVTVDTTARTVDVYKQGDETKTAISHRENCSATVGPVYLATGWTYGWIDDISVTNDVTGETVYKEDFESVEDIYLGEDASYKYLPYSIGSYQGGLRASRADATDNWSSRELVPASAIGEIKQYVISFDLTSEQASGSWTHYILLSWGSGSRNIVGLHSDSSGDSFKQLVANYETLATGEYGSLMNKKHNIRLEVNAETGVTNFWMDGIKTGTLTNTGFQNGGFSFGASHNAVAVLDNLVVTAGTVADLLPQVRLVGVQNAKNDAEKTYAVRFVGALGDDVNLEDYTEVGFEITATYGESENRVLSKACTTVYSKIVGQEGGVATEYSAENLGATYLFALAIHGIPESIGNVTFTVTSYYATELGTVKGETYTVVYNAGDFVEQIAN